MKVMKVYIADDGTRFDNGESCELYELGKMKGRERLICIDNYGERFRPLHLNEEWYQKTAMVGIPDEEALNTLRAHGEYYGFPTPDSVGISYYSLEDNDWKSVSQTKLKYSECGAFLRNYDKIKSLMEENKEDN